MHSIYNDGYNYDDIHWWKTNDLGFWSNVFADIAGNSVLELGCGTGRIAQSFLRDGAAYTGLELSTEFVAFAKNKLTPYGKSASIVCGDMRNFNLDKTFDLIFVGFNSFLHLLYDDDAISCLSCVKDHMHNKSRFIIDVYIPNPLFLYRPRGVAFPIMEYLDSRTNRLVYVEESNEYDSVAEINKLIWSFSLKNKIVFRKEVFLLRMYFPCKLNQLLIDSGFKILNKWGDYYRNKLSGESKIQIYDSSLK